MKYKKPYSVATQDLFHSQHNHLGRSDRRNTQQMPLSIAALAFFVFLCAANTVFAENVAKLHTITLEAKRITANGIGGNSFFAYRMQMHKRSNMDLSDEMDLTANYPTEATVPGPTIIINEGDTVNITLKHEFDPASNLEKQVSVHVHGVHYDIESDGTIEFINLYANESAIHAIQTWEYTWFAAPGTAGTWAYHDHNMLTLNGAEDKGLYGALIVNSPASTMALNKAGKLKTVPLSSIKKEYVMFIGDDAFWGTEIDNQTGHQTALGYNPTLSAQQGSNVRFHLIALGTNSHHFKLSNYGWIDPGTNLIINKKAIGPLEKHVFAVQAGQSSQYKDDTFSSNSLGMKGKFNVIP